MPECFVTNRFSHLTDTALFTGEILRVEIDGLGLLKAVEGGTQKLDGFWRGLKDSVARRGFKNGPHNSKACARLYRLVREWQWRYWHLHFWTGSSFLVASLTSSAQRQEQAKQQSSRQPGQHEESEEHKREKNTAWSSRQELDDRLAQT